MKSKMIKIEENSKLIEDTVGGIVTSISAFMSESAPHTSELSSNQVAFERFDDIENAMQCIQEENHRMKRASIADGERVITMNRQLHILSAKYVEFNEKINKYLFAFNRGNPKQIEPNDIIDSETKPFIPNEHKYIKAKLNPQPNANQKHNSFGYDQKLPNRFAQRHNMPAFTKVIKIHIRDTKIYDLNRFEIEFKEQFESILANKIMKSIGINEYHMSDKVVTSIVITVSMNVPLSHQYIDNFAFPSNWDFLKRRVTNKFAKQVTMYESKKKRK